MYSFEMTLDGIERQAKCGSTYVVAYKLELAAFSVHCLS